MSISGSAAWPKKIMPFGGMLGSTFNFVFEAQMESLQNGDRFYYLQRLDGLHLFGEMENNSFAAHDHAQHRRDASAVGRVLDARPDPGSRPEPSNSTTSMATATLESNDPVGGGILTQLVVRNNPALPAPTPTTCATPATSTSCSAAPTQERHPHCRHRRRHAVRRRRQRQPRRRLRQRHHQRRRRRRHHHATSAATTTSRPATATTWSMPARASTSSWAAPARTSSSSAPTGSEVFGGEGNDFIFGNKNAERILGNEGDDWLETGTFDGAPGDNFDEIFAQDGVDGHDVFLGDGGFDEFIGEGGDDIMVGSPGRGKMAGMSGFDWATYKDNTARGERRPVHRRSSSTKPRRLRRTRRSTSSKSVEGLSGSRFNDILTGSNDDRRRACCRSPRAGRNGFTSAARSMPQGIALHQRACRPCSARASPPSSPATSSSAATAAT